MKKITYIIFTFIVLIFVNNCSGYKPIFGSGNLKFKISNYSIEGDKILGNQILSKLQRVSRANNKDQNVKSIDVFIDSTKSKISTVKDIAGKIQEYKITLTINISVSDYLSDKQILNETFVSSTSYKVQDNYSETVDAENRSIENLINNIYQQLLIKLSQKIGAE
tara:strand:- start:1522 stop:2016 length:495 start_codon:yes stop_codon:yes gene_type:complete